MVGLGRLLDGLVHQLADLPPDGAGPARRHSARGARRRPARGPRCRAGSASAPRCRCAPDARRRGLPGGRGCAPRARRRRRSTIMMSSRPRCLHRVAGEVEEAAGLLRVADLVHGADRHGAVAGPREAVVPVARAAGPGRQARGGRRHHGSGGRVLQQLQHQRRAHARRDARARRRSCARPRPARSDAWRAGARRTGTPPPSPDASPASWPPARRCSPGRRRKRARAPPFGSSSKRTPRPTESAMRCISPWATTPSSASSSLRVAAPVVEARVEEDLHLHGALAGLDQPVQLVHARVRVAGPGHEVGEHHHAAPGLEELGLEHVGGVVVGLAALAALRGDTRNEPPRSRRGASRTRSASRSAAGRASRSSRPPRRARPSGRRRSVRSGRSSAARPEPGRRPAAVAMRCRGPTPSPR